MDLHSVEHARLKTLCSQVRTGDPANIEAQAAKVYWGGVFSSDTFSRNRFSQDAHNGLLNYGYTILRGLIIRHVVASGLWPTLGVCHHNRGNAFALADDLIEPFRPAVDWVVQQLPEQTQVLDAGVRQKLVGVGGLKSASSDLTLSSQAEKLCQHFGQYVEGKLDTFPVFQWKPEGL